MPTFYLQISDGKEAEASLECSDNNEAVHTAMTALSQFTSSHFPPPERVSIEVADANKQPVAKLTMTFNITYWPSVKIQ